MKNLTDITMIIKRKIINNDLLLAMFCSFVVVISLAVYIMIGGKGVEFIYNQF